MSVRSRAEPDNLLIIGASSSVNTPFPDLSPEFHPIVAELPALCKKKMLARGCQQNGIGSDNLYAIATDGKT